MLLNGCCKNNWLTRKSGVKSDKKSHIQSYIKALILSYRKQCCHGQKLLLLIIGMMVMPAYGLSKKSLRTINGSSPYLIFDDGTTNLKLKNWNDLFLLGYYEKDKLVYYPLDDRSYYNYELPLNFSGLTFADLWSIVPPKAPTLLDNEGNPYQKISLAELLQLPYYSWQDDDGDTGISGHGEIILEIAKTTINYDSYYYFDRTEKIDPCDYVYTFDFRFNKVSLATQYGDPRETDYSSMRRNYHIYPSVTEPYLCYGVRVPGGPSYGQEDGVSGEWQSDKGMFFIQSHDSPLGNPPTMGFSGAAFDLFVATGRERKFSYTKQPIDSPLSLNFDTRYRTSNLIVRINGPDDYSLKEEAMSFKPTTFTIYAGEMQTKQPIYQFTIKKWIIAHDSTYSNEDSNHRSMLHQCDERFGYTLPRIAELTNAKIISEDPKDYLLNDGYTAKRQIGGGFVAQWGRVSKISGQPARNLPEEAFSEEGYLIRLQDGRISGSKHQTRGLFCISPDQ